MPVFNRMKRIALIAALAISFVACKKGEDPAVTTNTFTTKVNGVAWKANETTWSKVNSMLQIEGTNGNTFIRLSVPNYSGPKTYALGASLYSGAYVEGATTYAAKDENITITSEEGKAMKGTFTFNASTNNTNRKLESGVFILIK